MESDYTMVLIGDVYIDANEASELGLFTPLTFNADDFPFTKEQIAEAVATLLKARDSMLNRIIIGDTSV